MVKDNHPVSFSGRISIRKGNDLGRKREKSTGERRSRGMFTFSKILIWEGRRGGWVGFMAGGEWESDGYSTFQRDPKTSLS